MPAKKISAIRSEKPYTIARKAQVDALALNAIKFLEMGMFQFPDEWRNYWAAAYVYEAAGMKQPALDVLARGLKHIPAYDEGGRGRLAMSLKSMEQMPDEPPAIEPELRLPIRCKDSATDSTAVVASAGK
jgi:hypothetical protein